MIVVYTACSEAAYAACSIAVSFTNQSGQKLEGRKKRKIQMYIKALVSSTTTNFDVTKTK